jgi:Rhamnan synthesis protein F
VLSDTDSLRGRYKAFRKKLLSFMPFIRRTRHLRALAHLQKTLDHERQTNEGMGLLFFSPPPLAATARHMLPVPIKKSPTEELCLFVTHVAARELKPHVIDHVNALIDAGVEVLLIANADVEPASLQLPPEFATRLYGCLIRENVGFDFAAWSHAYCLIEPEAVRQRLYLINDSIIGPLDLAAYRAVLAKIRAEQADVVGLTSNPDPHDHLQSFYIVFNERLLRSPVTDAFMRGIVNLPHKQNVIDCYEIWLSPFLSQQGFKCATVFPNFSKLPPPHRNDTLCAWRELLDAGFPFIKSMVLRDPVHGDASRQLLPARYR